MTVQWALVWYTFLTQLAAGLALFTTWRGVRAARAGEYPPWGAWPFVVAASCAGLICSLFGPVRPGGLLPGLEGLAFTVLTALAFVSWQFKGRLVLDGLAALAGLTGVVLQGVRAAPAPFTTPGGALPLLIFAAGAVALGAACAQARLPEGKKGFSGALRVSLWILLILQAVVPCLGTSADPVLRSLSLAWMEFLPYWAGVMATGVALGLSYMGRGTAVAQALLVLVAAFCLRLTLFGSSAPLSLY